MPGYSRRDLEEDAVPELVRVAHGVGLVGHVHARLAAAPWRARSAARMMRSTPLRVFTSSLMATSSRRAALELAAHAHVDALGVLAEDDDVDVLRGAALERDEAIGERAHGADVGVEVEAEAHAEEDVARVLEVGHARIAEGAEEDGARTRAGWRSRISLG